MWRLSRTMTSGTPAVNRALVRSTVPKWRAKAPSVVGTQLLGREEAGEVAAQRGGDRASLALADILAQINPGDHVSKGAAQRPDEHRSCSRHRASASRCSARSTWAANRSVVLGWSVSRHQRASQKKHSSRLAAM